MYGLNFMVHSVLEEGLWLEMRHEPVSSSGCGGCLLTVMAWVYIWQLEKMNSTPPMLFAWPRLSGRIPGPLFWLFQRGRKVGLGSIGGTERVMVLSMYIHTYICICTYKYIHICTYIYICEIAGPDIRGHVFPLGWLCCAGSEKEELVGDRPTFLFSTLACLGNFASSCVMEMTA